MAGHVEVRNSRRSVVLIGLALALALVASSCQFYPAAFRTITADPDARPWWCVDDIPVTAEECLSLSALMDYASDWALDTYPEYDDAIAGGGFDVTGLLFPDYASAGANVVTVSPPPGAPDTLYYDSKGRLAGLAYSRDDSPPNDRWVPIANGAAYILNLWIAPGYENNADVFAAQHPCLVTVGVITSTADPCFVATHTDPLDILVTNDDGVGAEGIDELVNELSTVPGVTVTVVAPATNQSGTSDTTTPNPTWGPGQTASGVAAIAVDGTPADSVIVALGPLEIVPDLVMSGINEGQNMGPVIALSGTVGAARTAARRGVPAVAVSQGSGAAPDFPSGAEAALDWLEDYRIGLAGPHVRDVANINIPSCTAGSIRGTVETVVAAALDGRSYFEQNCESTVTEINDDVDAFNHGFIGIADAGLN